MLGTILIQSVGPVGLSVILGTLVFAEVLSCFLSTAAPLPDGGGEFKPSDAIARILTGWVVVCVLLISFFQMNFLTFFDGLPFAGLSFLGLTLVLALLKYTARSTKLGRTISTMRFVLAAFFLKGVVFLGAYNIDLLLAVVLLNHLLVSVLVFALSRREMDRPFVCHDRSILDRAFQNSDLLIVPFVLSGSASAIYIGARCLVMALTEILAVLGSAATPTLDRARERYDQVGFITAAARLNLGFLLMGGGIALGTLAVGPYFADAMGQSKAEFHLVLVWAVFGACAPVLFGATDTLLVAVGKKSVGRLFALGTFAVFAAAVISTPAPSAIFVAQCFAAMQILRVAAAAALLAKFAGVWPGLTALLLRQIRLL